MKEMKKRKRCLNKLRNSNTTSRLCLQTSSSDSSYPFLTLLEEICLLIENNNVEEKNETDIIENNNHIINMPLIDKALYPYSSLLQTFIYKASLHESVITEQVDNDNSFFHNIHSIGHPSQESVLHQLEKENINNFDYSYASRLKRMACQSETKELSNDHIYMDCDSDNSDLRYILQKMFPTREQDPDDMIYSRKLQSLSENALQEQNNADIPHANTQNFCEQQPNSIDISSFLDIKEYPHYMETKTRVNKHTVTDRVNEEFSYTRPTFKDKHLFDALMNNVHMQSLINNSNSPEIEGSTFIKKETVINDVGDSEMAVVENFLLQHLRKNN